MQNDGYSNDGNLRLDEVLADYLRRVDRGESISEDELVQANPEFSDQLRSYFNNEKVFAHPPIAETRDFHNQPTPPNALRIRCPHCHSVVDHAVDTEFVDLTCDSCGSHFSLVDNAAATRGAETLKKIGRFELIERLGVGGFGTVWKARDTELDRTVAVKVPRQGEMTSSEVEKFLREARAAAQLRHSNIVSIHEVGRDGDSVYIVSDLIRGVDLSDWLTGQQLTSREAAELMAKVCDALHHAHEQGVIHRDLKPGNIMMDTEGKPHLMDFGLARREVGEVTMTIDGQVLGTPAYMSPEQAQGESHAADRRSDIYSVGAILFELLTGERPFRGNARMLLHQVIHEQAPSPRQLNANVAKDLETITLKCLEKSPDERYQSADMVACELRRFLEGKPILARQIGRVAKAWRWCKRKPTGALLACMVCVFAIAGPVVALLQDQLRRQAKAAEQQATSERDKAIRLSEERRKLTFCSDLRQAKHLFELEKPDARVAELLLRNYLPGAEEDNARFEYRAMCDLVFPKNNVLHDGEPVVAIAVAASGSRIAAINKDGKLRVWNVKDRRQIASLQLAVTDHSCLALDDLGKRVAIGNDHGTAGIWDIDSANLLLRVQGVPKRIDLMQFAPDDALITISRDGAIEVWDLQSGKPLSTHTFATSHLQSEANQWLQLPLAISPNGQWAAIGGSYTQTMLWSREKNAIVATLQDDKSQRFEINCVCSLSFSRDSSSLISLHSYGTAFSYELPSLTSKRMRQAGGTSQPRCKASYLDSTLRVVGVTQSGILAVYDFELGLQYSRKVLPETWRANIESAQSRDGSVFVILDKDSGDVSLIDPTQYIKEEIKAVNNCYELRWSPSGRYLAIASGSEAAKVWDIQSGEVEAIDALAPPARGIAFSSNGKCLAYAEANKAVVVWNLIDKRTEATLEIQKLGSEYYSKKDDILHAVPLAFHPANPNKVFIGFGSGQVVCWEYETGTRKLVHSTGGLVKDLVFSSDGSLLLISVWKTGTEVYSVTQGKVIETYTDGAITSAISEDNSKIVLSTDGRLRIANRNTDRVNTLYGHDSHVTYACFCNDGNGLLTKDLGHIRFWNLDNGEVTFSAPCAETWFSAAMSQDERMFAYSPDRRHVRVIKSPQLDELRQRMPPIRVSN